MWTWDILKGQMKSDDGELVGVGYSGDQAHKNNPAAQGLKAQGPIPEGNYRVTVCEEHTTKHGPYVLVLEPDGPTRFQILYLGRDPDSFRIHGDSVAFPGTASEGCIILSRDVRGKIWTSTDHDLRVISGIEE